MKKTFVITALFIASLSYQASAINLEYMINPPKERTIEEVSMELQQAVENGNASEVETLKKELSGLLDDVQPAAGPNAGKPDYGHFLSH